MMTRRWDDEEERILREVHASGGDAYAVQKLLPHRRIQGIIEFARRKKLFFSQVPSKLANRKKHTSDAKSANPRFPCPEHCMNTQCRRLFTRTGIGHRLCRECASISLSSFDTPAKVGN